MPTTHACPDAASAAPGDRPCRVLLVSSEPNFTRALERILGRCGYDVSVVDCGEGAFGRAISDRFDLIVSQVDLPGSVCGITLLHRLREQGVEIPVVMLTEQDTDRLRRHLGCSPAATCLNKDVDLDLLKSTLAACLARAATHRPA